VESSGYIRGLLQKLNGKRGSLEEKDGGSGGQRDRGDYWVRPVGSEVLVRHSWERP
jgi:hypothetical protein